MERSAHFAGFPLLVQGCSDGEDVGIEFKNGAVKVLDEFLI